MVSNSSTSTVRFIRFAHREEHRLLHLCGGVSLNQQIHHPIRLIIGELLEPGDRDVTARPTSLAASFEHGSSARLATNANSTRSTSVVNRRGPSSSRSAVSIPS